MSSPGRRRGRRPGGLLLVALCGAVLAGCGVPVDAQPRALDLPAAPRDLATPTRTPVPGTSLSRLELFLVQNGRVVPVERRLTTTPTAQQALEALEAGPTPQELQRGLTSALPGAATPRSARLESHVIVVELGAQGLQPSRNDEALAYAQLVSTLAGLRGVSGVRFVANGKPIGVARGDGSVSTGRLTLTRSDYAELLGPAAPPSPPPSPTASTRR